MEFLNPTISNLMKKSSSFKWKFCSIFIVQVKDSKSLPRFSPRRGRTSSVERTWYPDYLKHLSKLMDPLKSEKKLYKKKGKITFYSAGTSLYVDIGSEISLFYPNWPELELVSEQIVIVSYFQIEFIDLVSCKKKDN